MTKVFISYQSGDRFIAARLQESLAQFGINSFMAHEDIQVSQEWRGRILQELHEADACICLLSANYLGSVWCVQEAGIAAYNHNMVPIPLRLDESIPPGFLSAIQARRCDPELISIRDIIPGLLHGRLSLGIDIVITMIENSRSFRGAEANFELLMPHIGHLSAEQGKKLLLVSYANGQVMHAGQCANEYIPAALVRYGRYLSLKDQQEMIEICNRYNSEITLEDIVA